MLVRAYAYVSAYVDAQGGTRKHKKTRNLEITLTKIKEMNLEVLLLKKK